MTAALPVPVLTPGADPSPSRPWTLSAALLPVPVAWVRFENGEAFLVEGNRHGFWTLRPTAVLLSSPDGAPRSGFLALLGEVEGRALWAWGRVGAFEDCRTWQYAASDTPEDAAARVLVELWDGWAPHPAMLDALLRAAYQLRPPPPVGAE